MTSFLRTQVLTANIAKIASVTPRTRGSSKVLIASTAIAAYANNANINLFVTSIDPEQNTLGISPADSRFAHTR
jgi:hypothetical protein